jgi:GNAT superfamily N-acetyltransferase
MGLMRIDFVREADRPALCRMLSESRDFPQSLLYLYQRRSGPDENLVAWRGDDIDGVLTGSFGTDLAASGAFDSFELPPRPHAFLTRIHVRAPARRSGIGRALIRAYAVEASERGCTFIGGSIDLSSESIARRSFFEQLGFSIRALDNFGAGTSDVLTAVAQR